jgi:hypothetical protein
MTRLNVNEAACGALFASPLLPSEAPTAETVADAIGNSVRRLGPTGCASHMAQEFGDHPEGATHRMRWVRKLTGDPSRADAWDCCVWQPACSAAKDGPQPSGRWQARTGLSGWMHCR